MRNSARNGGDALLYNAQQIWDYLCLGAVAPGPVDVVVALGSHDSRVAVRAIELMSEGLAPLLVVSGGRGKDTPSRWSSEAAHFAQLAEDGGIPRSKILLEPRATNTGENIIMTKELLLARGLRARSVILVSKPYMQRRAYATALVRWPEVEHYTTAPASTLQDYLTDGAVDRDDFLNLMVGDLQRMRVYADRGFQAEQDVPDHVWAAFEEMVAAGYDRYVLGSG